MANDRNANRKCIISTEIEGITDLKFVKDPDNYNVEELKCWFK